MHPHAEELAQRIHAHVGSAGAVQDLVSACWHGYLAALLEWGLISPADHLRLVDLLPPLEPNPVLQIFLGV